VNEQPATQTPPITSDADRAATVRRRVRDELYQRLVLFSAVTWTLGTFLLFTAFAANDPSPVPKAMLAMTVPLVPAALPWLFFRRLSARLATRPLRETEALDFRAGAPTGRQMAMVVRLGIIALASATALIHIVLAIPLSMVGFYLNGLGYLALVAALYLPRFARYRRVLRWVLMGYTGLTIILWAVLGRPYTTIGYLDKAIELGLLTVLWFDRSRSRG
jgi:hypothetical protein